MLASRISSVSEWTCVVDGCCTKNTKNKPSPLWAPFAWSQRLCHQLASPLLSLPSKNLHFSFGTSRSCDPVIRKLEKYCDSESISSTFILKTGSKRCSRVAVCLLKSLRHGRCLKERLEHWTGRSCAFPRAPTSVLDQTWNYLHRGLTSCRHFSENIFFCCAAEVVVESGGTLK